MPEQYYPVLLALGVALTVGVSLLAVSAIFGGARGGARKRTTYESGMPLLDRAHKRMSILFFLIAIDFIVFDVEAAFLYPWVLVLEDGGWPLFWAVMVFIALILVGYVYIWKKGGLDLARPKRERTP